MNIVEFDNVTFSYRAGAPPVLENVTFSVAPGEFFGLIGPNASGKSTLLRLMIGLLKPQQGSVRLLGGDPRENVHRVGYVPQHPTFSRHFPISVIEVVMLGLLGANGRRLGGFTAGDREAALAALRAAEIESVAMRPVSTLSGGQLQRVLIARALACQPELLVLDEPTANVDVRAEEDIFALLRGYSEGMAIVVVSHDVGFISSYVDRVGCLNRRLAVHETAELTGRLIEDLYGAPVRVIRHDHA
jgi:zinc transport system ATP-binding protein